VRINAENIALNGRQGRHRYEKWHTNCIALGQGENIMQKTSGFTLMELMVTIAIIAILSAIAIPNFIAWVPKFKLGGGCRDVLAILQKTRVQAVKDNTNYVLMFDTGNESYTAFLDDGAGTPANSGNGVLDGGERVLVQKTLANGIDISATTLPGDLVVFNTQGIASTAGTITLTDNSGNVRQIFLELAGSSRIQE
jgi:type IV fimbrial biogenesis protein FimT